MNIKICGITQSENAAEIAQLDADYLGLIFVEASPRFVSTNKATAIQDAVSRTGKTVEWVGVFQNPDLETIATVLRSVKLDWIQLHGDESVSFCQMVKERFECHVIKTIGIASYTTRESLPKIHLARLSRVVDAFLFDTQTAAAQGGTGQSFDYNVLMGLPLQQPVFIAGGLGSVESVQALTRVIMPFAIDCNSHLEVGYGTTEHQVGLKSVAKCQALIDFVRR